MMYRSLFLVHRHSILAASMSVAAAALVGCSQKPPACADDATLALVRKMVADDALAEITAQNSYQPDTSKRAVVQRIADRYAASLKVSLSQIVTNGFNSESKKYSCAGKLEAATPQGDVFSVSTAFSTQRTEDSKSSFVLEIDNYQPLLAAVVQQFGPYLVREAATTEQRSNDVAAAKEVPPVAGGNRSAGSTPPSGKVKYTKEEGSADLEVSDGQLMFSIRTNMGPSSCDLSGTARWSDRTTAKYASADTSDACTVTFKFIEGQLDVETSECNERCGMQAAGTMDGLYSR
jgi:hypothetical protein